MGYDLIARCAEFQSIIEVYQNFPETNTPGYFVAGIGAIP
jgi:hypothetical protein